ncbi:MAG TPA: PadR family transcriptional regulator [Gaiellaceae bacterium]|jgi:DNA-binding PadR family transcriptional regulator|nr:PadR family transcriptional regulator [Gaiellaceae bacterium]
MSRVTLTPTAKIILGFLRFRPRSGYDIKQAVEISTRFFWGASYGQIYPELQRLERAGLVEIEQVAERRRKVYRLTPAGESALADWLGGDDGDFFQYRDEGMLRLFFSDFVDAETALGNVRRMREWRDDALAFLRAEIEPYAQEDMDAGLPFPLRALHLGIAMLEAQRDWLAELERELRDR